MRKGNRYLPAGLIITAALLTASVSSAETACSASSNILVTYGVSVDAVVTQAAATASGFLSETQAAGGLLTEYPGASVVDGSLVEIEAPAAGLPQMTVWALAVKGMPVIGSNGPAGAGGHAMAICTIAFIDATTGKLAFGIQEGTNGP